MKGSVPSSFNGVLLPTVILVRSYPTHYHLYLLYLSFTSCTSCLTSFVHRPHCLFAFFSMSIVVLFFCVVIVVVVVCSSLITFF